MRAPRLPQPLMQIIGPARSATPATRSTLPYTAKVLSDLEVSRRIPDGSLRLVTTDLDEILLERGRIACKVDPGAMVTQRFALDDIEAAYDLFANQRAGVLKVAITP
jgi:hypothetical protein